MSLLTPPPDRILRDLGARLQQARLGRGWSLKEMALRAGLPLSTYKRLEYGGQGSTIALVRVLVALGRQGEIDALAAPRVEHIDQVAPPPVKRRRGRTITRDPGDADA
jgi:transcriptional regulator with XRE-family HTH domain